MIWHVVFAMSTPSDRGAGDNRIPSCRRRRGVPDVGSGFSRTTAGVGPSAGRGVLCQTWGPASAGRLQAWGLQPDVACCVRRVPTVSHARGVIFDCWGG
jgi:hypothetical protein